MPEEKTLTWRDFDSRDAFFHYLKLYHYDKSRDDKHEFTIMGQCHEDYSHELQWIHDNIETIKTTWNDQSPAQVQESVQKLGQRAIEVSQAQHNDKVRAGYRMDAPMYRVNNVEEGSVFNRLGEALGLEYSLARWHVQFPGECTFWHVDIFHPAHKFLPPVAHNIPDEKVGHDVGIRRIMVMLEDWDWGQMMMFGKTPCVDWRAGDIVYWPYGMPHAMANCGFTPRISVSITGMATDKFYTILEDYKNR